MKEEYKTALTIGQKQYKKSIHMNADPYPAVLSELLKSEKTQGERAIGTIEIPLHLIAGTKEKGRSGAFSKEFYPLLDENSEFAGKWNALYQSQMEEGIRDPIKVYEYKNRFYVQEGNKRVSVGQFLGMPTIAASVTRILPEKNDTPESKKYYEFVRFYEKTRLYQILFSKCGSYEKMLKLLGKSWEDEWTEDEITRLSSVFFHFSQDFEKLNPGAEPEKIGDGFLSFLEIMPYNETKEKSSTEIREEVLTMKPELKGQPESQEVHRVLAPEEIKPTLVDKILPTGKKQVKAAFIYNQDPKTSAWIYAHELGRLHVNEIFPDKVTTTVYKSGNTNESRMELIDAAVKDGNNVIFTTAPDMMPAEVKAALTYPDVYFFNCSVNFPYKTVKTYYVRMYEAKFLTGLLAGVLAGSEDISYEAGYPIYGTVAEINAFALGVQMVNPNAKIRLSWACLKDSGEDRSEKNGQIISAKENITSPENVKSYGLYRKGEDKNIQYAAAIINWGRFYEQLLTMILEGTLKTPSLKKPQTINYWWGMSSDVIDVIYSKKLPPRVQVLIEEFRGLLKRNEFHPFTGGIPDQNQKIHGAENECLSNEEIITMNWLCENVIGSIPDINDLTEKGALLAEVQGVQQEET